MMAKFELQDNVQPVIKMKRNVLFASLEQINEELGGLVKTGVLSKLVHREWAGPTVYEKKHSKSYGFALIFRLNEMPL